LENHNTFDSFFGNIMPTWKVGAAGRRQHLVSEEAEIIALHLFELLLWLQAREFKSVHGSWQAVKE
jgi:hypothetical protein